MPAGSQPDGPIQVVNVHFRYTVSDEWLEMMVETEGVEAPKTWTFDAKLDEVEPEYRLRLKRAQDYYMRVSGFPEFILPPPDVETFLEMFEDWTKSGGGEREETGSPDPFDVERDEWISKYGSSHLKNARSRGYKVNRTYAEERIERDFPRAWLDMGGGSEWRERTDPTPEALQLELKVQEWIDERPDLGDLQARIVWMIEPPPDLSEAVEARGEFFGQQEVLVVPEYLNRYTVVIPVDEDLWSDRGLK